MAAPVVDSRIVTPTVPTLFQSALVKVALPLLNDFGKTCLDAAFKHLKEQTISLDNKNTQKITLARTMSAIKKLHLIPTFLRVRVMEAVRGLEYEVCQWEQDHFKFGDKERILFWRSDGSIDRIKTVRQLVVNPDIDTKERFYLASMYCLEDSVRTLWPKVEASFNEVFCPSSFSLTLCSMVPFWIQRMLGDPGVPWTLAAAEYLSRFFWIPGLAISSLFPLLQPEDRRKILIKLKYFSNYDFRFCLYAMTMEEQEQVLSMCALKVLKLHSEWPLRNLFFQTADKLWHFVDETSFCELLRHVLKQVQPLGEDFKHCELVDQLWNMSPRHYRERARKIPFISQEIDLCLGEVSEKIKAQDEIIEEVKKNFSVLHIDRKK